MTDDLSTRLLAEVEKRRKRFAWVELHDPERDWILDVTVNEARDDLAICAAHREIIEFHRPVMFTDLELGLQNVVVCHTCHGRLDEPEGWDGADWPYPLVQMFYPCPTVQSFARAYGIGSGVCNEL